MQKRYITFIMLAGFLFAYCADKSPATNSSSTATTGTNNKDSAVSQEVLGKYFYKHFQGKLDDKIGLSLELTVLDTLAKGHYYYDNAGIPIYVNGSYKSGKLILSEYTKDNVSGTFTLDLTPDGKLNGSWNNPANGKKLNASLAIDYSQSLEMDCFYKGDSVHVDKKQDQPAAFITLFLILPSDKNKQTGIAKIKPAMFKTFFGDSVKGTLPATEIENKAKKYFSDFQADIKSMSDMPSGTNWDNQAISQVVYNSKGLLSTSTNFYEFSGGAHGSGASINTSYDVQSGDLITENIIFKSGFEEKLSTILVNKVLKQSDMKSLDEMTNAGFMLESIKANGNFYLTPKGITYMYNSYEIAPYAFGSFEVYVPFDEISGILKPEGIVAKIKSN